MIANNYRIFRADESHAKRLAPFMRAADRAEVLASHGLEPATALMLCVRTSPLFCWAAEDDHGVIVMWGVGAASRLSSVGHPWLLAADRLAGREYLREFLRLSREYVSAFRREYDFLENYVDARNELSLRWLRWCGFRVEPPAPYGAEGQMFCQFTMQGGK